MKRVPVKFYDLKYAMRSLRDWSFGFDRETREGKILHDIAVESAATVLREIASDSHVGLNGGMVYIDLYGSGGLEFSIKGLLTQDLGDEDCDLETLEWWAKTLKDISSRYEAKAKKHIAKPSAPLFRPTPESELPNKPAIVSESYREGERVVIVDRAVNNPKG